MFRLDPIYRTNYTGENITTEARQQGSTWQYTSEWVPISVFNSQTAKVATVIGNGDSRKLFELKLAIDHQAGMLGNKTMQTYGCNAGYRDSTPTFLIATGNEMCQELAESGYCDTHIVYANADKVLKYPGKFYLIPQDITANSGTIAAYLACFDGHEKVYLLGFDGWAGNNHNNNIYAGTNAYAPVNQNIDENVWVSSLVRVMQAYPEVEFVRVMPTINWRCATALKQLANFRQITYADYAIEVDL